MSTERLESPMIFVGIVVVAMALSIGLYFGIRATGGTEKPAPGPKHVDRQAQAPPEPEPVETVTPKEPEVHYGRGSSIDDIGRRNREAALNGSRD